MRDKTHMESVERWANYVKNNPDWKRQHTAFINAQIEMARRAIEKIRKQPGGKEKLMKLYNISNRKVLK